MHSRELYVASDISSRQADRRHTRVVLRAWRVQGACVLHTAVGSYVETDVQSIHPEKGLPAWTEVPMEWRPRGVVAMWLALSLFGLAASQPKVVTLNDYEIS